uniref:Bifunctional inhibitor/plant lipid transfer protein/seed storage helical domain-containing protein n=1 Tax=Salix viminalis TaxID=40686 RepID=A0A6N2KM37_SALVM
MDSHSHYTISTRLKMIVILLMSAMVSFAVAATDKNREECAEQLVGLATCLPYVGGDAKAPTPDCCNGLKQVLKDNKKCLCVIIKDRNDPELGLKINATLALSLPSVCHAPANVSQCPALLNLPPNSPDAQIFYQLANSSSHGASSPAPSPGPSAGAQSQGSNGCRSGKMIFGLEIVSLGLCFHICSLLFM